MRGKLERSFSGCGGAARLFGVPRLRGFDQSGLPRFYSLEPLRGLTRLKAELRTTETSTGAPNAFRRVGDSVAAIPRSTMVRHGGFLLAELITGTALLGVVIVGLMVSMNGFALVNDCQWARQRCTAAAQAQLDSLAATGKAMEPQELERLWPGVEVSVDRSLGAAPWHGLEQIQVTAAAQAGPRKITIRLARYAGRASGSTGILPASSMGVPPMSTRGILPRGVLLKIDPGSLTKAAIFGQDARATHGRDGRATHGRDAHATHGRDGRATHGRDGRATHGRDAHATGRKEGDSDA